MFQTWTFWSLLLVAMVFNSFYTSLHGQRLVRAEPALKPIELAYARRQQRWSVISVLIALAGGYLDWRYAHRGFLAIAMAVGLSLTVALMGVVYAWHERMLRALPDAPLPSDGPEDGP